MVAAALLSSKTDEWATPQSHFAKWNEEFGPFDLDPCATAENAKAAQFYTKELNGLSQNWDTICAAPDSDATASPRIWCNPPYGRGIGAWVRKAALCRANLVVMLLPARTDTRWWHDYVIPYSSEIRFIRGRLKFGGAKNSAPFPSALVIFKRT